MFPGEQRKKDTSAVQMNLKGLMSAPISAGVRVQLLHKPQTGLTFRFRSHHL
jgi:hypothetical protein